MGGLRVHSATQVTGQFGSFHRVDDAGPQGNRTKDLPHLVPAIAEECSPVLHCPIAFGPIPPPFLALLVALKTLPSLIGLSINLEHQCHPQSVPIYASPVAERSILPLPYRIPFCGRIRGSPETLNFTSHGDKWVSATSVCRLHSHLDHQGIKQEVGWPSSCVVWPRSA